MRSFGSFGLPSTVSIIRRWEPCDDSFLGLRVRERVVAVLGNHDDCHMVAPMEAMGVVVLVNEALHLSREGQTIQVVGTDDVHYYYTDQALVALQSATEASTVALVHSAEICDAAADMRVALYRCGPSHVGQICLPTGVPFIKRRGCG